MKHWIAHPHPAELGMMLYTENGVCLFASSEQDLNKLLDTRNIDNLDYIEGLVLLKEKIKHLERIRNA